MSHIAGRYIWYEAERSNNVRNAVEVFDAYTLRGDKIIAVICFYLYYNYYISMLPLLIPTHHEHFIFLFFVAVFLY